jgi:hypothetical protein
MHEHILRRSEMIAVQIGLGLEDSDEVAWYRDVLETLNAL